MRMAPTLALLLLGQVALYTTVTSETGMSCKKAGESRCLHDGTWSNPTPLHKAVNCPLPEPPTDEVSCTLPAAIPNGFITFAVMRKHGYKEKVKYACNEHYILDGEAEIQCQKTGNWSSMPVCGVGVKRGRTFYNAKRLWIADLKPNRVLHGERVVFYCLNRAERCGCPVASTRDDRTLNIPECFEEPGRVEYTLRAKTPSIKNHNVCCLSAGKPNKTCKTCITWH